MLRSVTLAAVAAAAGAADAGLYGLRCVKNDAEIQNRFAKAVVQRAFDARTAEVDEFRPFRYEVRAADEGDLPAELLEAREGCALRATLLSTHPNHPANLAQP
jgi:hypothetical protein